MSPLAHFAAYAAAFEKAFADDDWSVVAPHFTEDAVYDVGLPPPLGGFFEGRQAVLDGFRDFLDHFDRRFESRELSLLAGPEVREDGSVWLRGSATYRAEGHPDFVLELEETAHFDGDRIRRLEDRFEPEMVQALQAYLEAHGAALGLGFDD